MSVLGGEGHTTLASVSELRQFDPSNVSRAQGISNVLQAVPQVVDHQHQHQHPQQHWYNQSQEQLIMTLAGTHLPSALTKKYAEDASKTLLQKRGHTTLARVSGSPQ